MTLEALQHPGAAGRRVDRADVRFVRAEFGTLPALGPLLPYMTFFSPAAIYLQGRFEDRLLADFLCQRGNEVTLYLADFQRPILTLPPDWPNAASWARRLLGVRAEVAHEFSTFFLSVKVSDPARQRLYGVGIQELTVVDPLYADRQAGVLPSSPPRIPLLALGVNAGHVAWGYESVPGQPLAPPVLRRYPPLPEAAALAEAYWRGAVPLDKGV